MEPSRFRPRLDFSESEVDFRGSHYRGIKFYFSCLAMIFLFPFGCLIQATNAYILWSLKIIFFFPVGR